MDDFSLSLQTYLKPAASAFLSKPRDAAAIALWRTTTEFRAQVARHGLKTTILSGLNRVYKDPATSRILM